MDTFNLMMPGTTCRRPFIALIGGVTLACGSYFMPNRHVSERVEDAAVIGTWRLTEESLRTLERDGFRREPGHAYTIAFEPNNRCRFASVLEIDKPSYLDAPCTWTLAHDVRDSNELRIPNQLKLEVCGSNGPFGWDLSFARDDGGLVLWEFYSAPDLWEFLEYAKAPSPPK
jgi:hypothetical protein